MADRWLLYTRAALRTLGACLSVTLPGVLTLPAHAETVQTRLGELDLNNGYPSPQTAEKLYDEMDFQRATQAYIWALPAVGFKALHDAQIKELGASHGDIVFYRDLKDKAGMLTPNITTLYAFSFWDLAKQGPMVVEVPAGLTAGGVLDIWQQPISDMGQTGPDKGKGSKYLIPAPGSADIDAPGHYVVRSSSNQVWFGTRGLDPDKAVAEATLRGHKIYAWEKKAEPEPTKFKEVGGRDWQSAQPNSLDVTRGPLVTDQGAADMSSRKEDLIRNADGSVDVYFGPVRPAGATNWIKTTAGKGWFPYFRFYGATEAYFDKS